MNIVYFGSMRIGRPNGPGLNEKDFLQDLENRSGINLFVYAPIEQGCTLNTQKIRIVRNVVGYPVLREIHAATLLCLDIIRKLVKPDVVVFRLGQLPLIQLAVIKILKFFDIPTHVKTVGVGICDVSQKRGLLNYVTFVLLRSIFRAIDSIDTPTELARRRIIDTFKLSGATVILVGNGAKDVSLDAQLSKVQGSTCYGYVGRFPVKRGGRQVIETVSHSLKLGLQATGLITGDNKEIAELKVLAESLGVSNKINFVGIVPQEEVAFLLSKIDVGFSIMEGILGTAGQKLRQYLMHGCMVVYGNDELMDSLKEEFIVPFIDPEHVLSRLVNSNGQVHLVSRDVIHKWARQNVSYSSFNSVRVNHLLKFSTHYKIG